MYYGLDPIAFNKEVINARRAKYYGGKPFSPAFLEGNSREPEAGEQLPLILKEDVSSEVPVMMTENPVMMTEKSVIMTPNNNKTKKENNNNKWTERVLVLLIVRRWLMFATDGGRLVTRRLLRARAMGAL